MRVEFYQHDAYIHIIQIGGALSQHVDEEEESSHPASVVSASREDHATLDGLYA